MNIKLFPQLKILLIVVLFVAFSNCEKDEVIELAETQNTAQNKVQVHTHNNVSKTAINFIKAKTNNTNHVHNAKGNIYLSNALKSTNNTTFGTVDTSKEIVVINKTNTKHTFKVIDNDGNNKTFVNLIVVETKNATYEYFLKYTLHDGVFVHDANGNLDFSKFRGRIQTFNNKGDAVGDIIIEDGGIILQTGQLAPCPDDPVDDDTNTNTTHTPTNGSSTNNASTNAGIPGSSGQGDGGVTNNVSNSSGGWFASSANDDCGLSWGYARCGCGGNANGHAPSGPNCCEGSPLVITDCNGNVLGQGKNATTTTVLKGNGTDPCDDNGDVGVILDEDELCVMDDESFNNYYSERSPFTVDMSEIRYRCNIIGEPKPENEKFMCVYNKLIKSPTFQNLFINVFGESKNINVTFKVKDVVSTSNPNVKGICKVIDGHTDQEGNLIDLDIEIWIKKDHLDIDSRIKVAKTIIHECIHAYLKLKKIDCNQGTTFDQINNKLLGELINEYYDGSCSQGQAGHEFMFDYMLPSMQNMLSDVRDNFLTSSDIQNAENINFESSHSPVVPNKPWDWNDFFYNISLEGLHNTNEFQQQIASDPIKNYLYTRYVDIGNQFSKTQCVE